MTRLEDELARLVTHDAPDADRRRDMARRALIRRAAPHARKRWRPPLVAAAAVILLGAALWWHERPEPAPDPHPAAPSEATDRARADRTLKDETFRRALAIARNKQTKYVLVARGRYVFGDSPAALLAAQRKLTPNLAQAYLFPIDGGIPGDMIADTARVQDRTVGLTFLQDAGIVVENVLGAIRFKRGKKEWVNVERAELTLTIQGRAGAPYAVHKDSLAPILLAPEHGYPLQEIPGTAILEGLDHVWYGYRRYLVRVQHEKLGLDAWLTAATRLPDGEIGAGNLLAARFGVHVFHGLRRPAAEVALAEKKALIVVHFTKTSSKRMHALFRSIPDIERGQYCVPHAPRDEIRFYTANGKLERSLVGPEITPEALREALR